MSIFRKFFGRDKGQPTTSPETPPMSLPEQITTGEQVQAVYKQANILYDKGDFSGAIQLYDRLLLESPTDLINTLEVKKTRAMAYCKAGRYTEAERDLKQLLDDLKRHGANVANSQVMYWYLVARYEGDENKAMDEFCNL